MYYHVYYLDIFRHVCKWHLIKYIHWHIVLHLRQTTKPLNRTFIKYTACCKSLGVKPVRYRSSTLTHEHLTNISLQHGALGALSISARAKKKRVPEASVLVVTFFWRAVSTDETSYEAGIKVQIHSQDEPPFIDQLGFGVAPGFQTFVSCQQQLVPNVQPPSPSDLDLFFAPLHSVFVPPNPSPASGHYLCVTESGAKSNCWFTLWGKSAVKVLNETTSFFWIHETEGIIAAKEYWQRRAK